MESKVRVLKHPLHPMLVMFPVAFFPLLLALDVLDYLYPAAGIWAGAFWVVVGGLAMTALAIVPGIFDLAAIPDGTKAHRTAFIHFFVGLAILALYAAALWTRWPVTTAPDSFILAAGLDLLGTLLVSAQGWLGGQLVYHHHVGVASREEGGDPVALEGAARARATSGAIAKRRGPSPP